MLQRLDVQLKVNVRVQTQAKESAIIVSFHVTVSRSGYLIRIITSAVERVGACARLLVIIVTATIYY